MKVYVRTRYEDTDGVHEVGEVVDLPRETDEQKLEFDRMVDYAIITTRKSDLPEGTVVVDLPEDDDK